MLSDWPVEDTDRLLLAVQTLKDKRTELNKSRIANDNNKYVNMSTKNLHCHGYALCHTHDDTLLLIACLLCSKYPSLFSFHFHVTIIN